ncbi:hypothetical protein [Anabaena sp. CCY 0017]|uniref:hypothetical protein n=1 Tax=Anabaena sp. CCY 0017 TaxID=3103866 RepID=UPI0039C6E0D7
MPRRRGNKVPAYVEFSGLKYGFQINQAFHNQYKGVLGQTTFAGAAGVFFGANSPKPNRATLEIAGGSRVSSFCSSAKINDLQKANWIVTASGSGIRGVKTAGATRTVYVDMPGGYKYAWNLTAAEVSKAGELGIEQASGSTDNMVWGSTPKPPRASKREGGSTVSTFIKPQASVIDAAVDKGWTVRGVSYDLIPNA